MSDVTFDVTYTEQRSRLTTLFRIILAFPHLICASLWGYAASFVGFLQWFVILFTGQRNQGMWRFQRGYLSYLSRVNGYTNLLFDTYPGFFNEWNGEPVAFDLRTDDRPNRLTNALRIIWIIPAVLVGYFILLAASFVGLAAWFVIVFTGRHPRGMFDFMLRALRLSITITAYGLLTTDDYPWYDSTQPTSALPPGDQSITGGFGEVGSGHPRYPQSAPGTPLPPPSGPAAG